MLGFTDLIAAPAGSIATGQSVLVSLAGQPRRESVVRSPIALHLNVLAAQRSDGDCRHTRPGTDIDLRREPSSEERSAATGRRFRCGTYPSSLMGAVAHLRQAMIDAEHNHLLHSYYSESGGPRPPFDPALKALYDARARTLPVWWEANNRDEIHRVLDLAEEFGTSCAIVGGKEAGKAVDRLKTLDVPVVFKLDFPEEPKAPAEAEVSQEEGLAHRDVAAPACLENKVATWKEWVATTQEPAKGRTSGSVSSSEGVPEVADGCTARFASLIAAGLSKEAAPGRPDPPGGRDRGRWGDRLGTTRGGEAWPRGRPGRVRSATTSAKAQLRVHRWPEI